MTTLPTPESSLPAHRWNQPDWAEPDLFLMADDTLIERADNAVFKLCPLEKEPQPVLLPTETWEGGDGKHTFPVHDGGLDGTVLYDAQNERYVLWYHTCNHLIEQNSGSIVCMATSKDGLQWEKPALRQVYWNGSYENNMLRVDVGPVQMQHLSGVVPNYLEDASSSLVATVYSSFDDAIYPCGITQLYGDDGVHWQAHWPPSLPLDGDAHCLTWDARRRCYLCTTRSAQQGRIIRRFQIHRGLHHLSNKRHIALAKSRDLVHWTPMLTILEADERDPENAEMYYMHIVPYGRHYLGFVQMFYMSEDMTRGPLEMHLALSDDGENWRRVGDKWVERAAILPCGGVGTWDCSVSLCTNPPFPTGARGERLRFWYGGKDTEHWQSGNAALLSATLRRDGFACWEAGAKGGVITTRLMSLKWATMPSLNVDAVNGEVRVEILKENGEPLEGCSAEQCTPITGDHIRHMVEWPGQRGSFVRHTGKVRFRFHLKNARLYAAKLPGVEAASGNIN